MFKMCYSACIEWKLLFSLTLTDGIVASKSNAINRIDYGCKTTEQNLP